MILFFRILTPMMVLPYWVLFIIFWVIGLIVAKKLFGRWRDAIASIIFAFIVIEILGLFL